MAENYLKKLAKASMYKSKLHLCRTCGKKLLEEKMKVGPKGQVVIPQAMRKALKIEPGTEVLFRFEDDQLIVKKSYFDAVASLQKIAKGGKSASHIEPHAAYEASLEARARKCST